MGWRSIRESEKRLNRLWFLPKSRRNRYRKTRVLCSCYFCVGDGVSIGDRRLAERSSDEIKEVLSDPIGYLEEIYLAEYELTQANLDLQQ